VILIKQVQTPNTQFYVQKNTDKIVVPSPLWNERWTKGNISKVKILRCTE